MLHGQRYRYAATAASSTVMPGPGNAVLTNAGRCVLIDFDEARVDDPAFDTGTTPKANGLS